jgi:hypothetical protein
MITPVSSSSSLYAADSVQSAQTQAAAPQKKEQAQDSVQLSAAALAASGDADHDGDSH